MRCAQTALLRFFLHTFPEAFRRLLPTLGVAAALFLATALFGLVVSLVSPGTGVAFIGPQALEGLERGELDLLERLWQDAKRDPAEDGGSGGQEPR